eukprot:scaffold486045_cov17-Prasinocladus_malaysianus.AAC.1
MASSCTVKHIVLVHGSSRATVIKDSTQTLLSILTPFYLAARTTLNIQYCLTSLKALQGCGQTIPSHSRKVSGPAAEDPS